ncbi:hypothetical protein TcasGA2_TC032895 [Tribolium castaneum]|uniref:Uncharacterized protein n=1 Tax=Tribolium castaneum TaxID=7070 RepID=A0A139WJZ3_TRICA|nr:hypothetical protein TcasGA2_TC032895 [Tribolium castaneum]
MTIVRVWGGVPAIIPTSPRIITALSPALDTVCV